MTHQSEKRILFIWPPNIIDGEVKDILFPAFKTHLFPLPLGIARLSTFLKSQGFPNVSFVDLNVTYHKSHISYWVLYKISLFYHRLLNLKNASIKREQRSGFEKKRGLSFSDVIAMKMNRCLAKNSAQIRASIPDIYEEAIHATLNCDSKKAIRRLHRAIKKSISSVGSGYVCISCLHPQQLFFSILIAQYVKEINSAIIVGIGGAHITHDIEQIIKENRLSHFLDFVIFGDGEKPLEMILNLTDQKDRMEIPNVCFRKEGQFEVSKAEYSINPEDVDLPDLSLFKRQHYDEHIPFIVSKGCWWGQCTFCPYSKGLSFSIRSVEKTIQDIKELQLKYGISKIRFYDDALPGDYLRALADRLMEEDMNIEWVCNIILSADFLDDALCLKLRRAGLQSVAIGLESISPRVLKKMNKYHKKYTSDEIKCIIDSLNRAHIGTRLNIMFGFPTETKEEAQKTLEFLIRNKYYNTVMQAFALDRDTFVFKHPELFGIKKIGKMHKKGQRLGHSFSYDENVSNDMSEEEARNFTWDAYRALQKERLNKRSCL